MKKEEFENKMNAIQEKLGKENASLIADELGLLITDNAQMNKELENKNNEISKLKTDKENLQEANINLLQQIPMGDDTESIYKKEEKPVEKPKPFDYRTVFDEKGNFKR
jgi:hypothetical protein